VNVWGLDLQQIKNEYTGALVSSVFIVHEGISFYVLEQVSMCLLIEWLHIVLNVSIGLSCSSQGFSSLSYLCIQVLLKYQQLYFCQFFSSKLKTYTIIYHILLKWDVSLQAFCIKYFNGIWLVLEYLTNSFDRNCILKYFKNVFENEKASFLGMNSFVNHEKSSRNRLVRIWGKHSNNVK